MAKAAFHQLASKLPVMMADGGTGYAGDSEGDSGFTPGEREVDPWEQDENGEWVRASVLRERRANLDAKMAWAGRGRATPDPMQPAAPTATALPSMEQGPIRQDLFDQPPAKSLAGATILNSMPNMESIGQQAKAETAKDTQSLFEGSGLKQLGQNVIKGIMEPEKPLVDPYAGYSDEAKRQAQASVAAGETTLINPPGTSALATAPINKGVSAAAKAAGAADDVVDAAKGVADDFAGNIRLSKYAPDVRDTVKQWADENPDVMQAARRGTIPDAEVQTMARELVDEVGGDFNKIQKQWKPGDAWNAEEIVAIRGTLAAKTREVVEAAADNSPEGHLRLLSAITGQQRVQQIVHGTTAEAGRALRAFRQQADQALGSGDVKQVQDLLATASRKGMDLDQLAAAVKALDPNNPTSIHNFVRNVNKPDFWEKLRFYWYNSILSGPLTHARNVVGNASALATMPVQRVGAGLIDAPLASLSGRQQTRFIQEGPAAVVGMVRGFPEGLRAGLRTFTTGFDPAAINKFEVRPAPIGGVAGRVVGLPTTMLAVADSFFSPINFRASLQANALRMARSQGLKGQALSRRIDELVANPPPGLMNNSVKQSEELLFRNDPGDLARAISGVRSKAPLTEFLMPFIRTPANLLKYSAKNSPLGLLDYPMWRRVIERNPDVADELVRPLMASAVTVAISSLVATGQLELTAGAPANEAERDRFFREGKQPFSVNLPGVGWVKYNNIPLLDHTLTMIAATHQALRDGGDPADVASQALATIGQSIMDKSYISGLSSFLEAAGDPARYAASYAERMAGGFAPFSGGLRQTAQIMDPTIRDPQNLSESLQAGIPGMTGNVPPRLDAFGQESQRATPYSPVTISADKQSAVDAELGRIGKEVGFVGDTIGGFKLTREEQAEFQRQAGQLTATWLSELFEMPIYQRLNDLQKEKEIEAIIRLARDRVRDAMAEELPAR
jgi:hypothetical protein